MVIFGIKMTILYFKKAKEISKHILIWMAAINCDSNLVFIYFTMCLITFLSLKYEKGFIDQQTHSFIPSVRVKVFYARASDISCKTKIDRWTDRRTDRWTDRRTDGRMWADYDLGGG